MRKYYHPAETPHRCGAANHAHWDALWSATAFEEAYRSVENHFLHAVFHRYFPKKGKILEAGCGLGQYVAYYRERGYDIEGVDSSPVGIEKVKERYPGLPVQVADIRRLPYASQSISVYFSGGVMEHFEEGPWEALAEARRVLKDDGLLIMTVPFMNAARSLRDAFGLLRGGHYRVVSGFGAQPALGGGREFYQHAFSRKEIIRTVQAAGFHPIETRPAQIAWGAKKLFGRQNNAAAPAVVTPRSQSNAPGGWRRTLLRERSDNPAIHWALRVFGWGVGHMILLVCRKSKI